MSKVGKPENQLVQVSTDVLLDRSRKDLENASKVEANVPLNQYTQMVGKSGDWTIVEQGTYKLPLDLTSLISLQLRDEGNALIEETRQLNNENIGSSFRYLEVTFGSDLFLIDLRERTLVWAEKVCKEVLYKLRNRVRDEPVETYLKFYQACVTSLDQEMAYRPGGMYQLVWNAVLDMIPYRLLDSIFLKTGKLVVRQGVIDTEGISITGPRTGERQIDAVMEHLSLYGVQMTSCAEQVILDPMLAELKAVNPLPPLDLSKRRLRAVVDGDVGVMRLR
ncbi:hypothetical protein [Noviherbaspirillum malthae]|uniref:hypothetical protein n=1 Tax=Noviherbaspirillum malthae TaxID=1260987 RepID=UPI00188DF3AA|nr:hypothetical protein [Noviherbaspirillum malthae]